MSFLPTARTQTTLALASIEPETVHEEQVIGFEPAQPILKTPVPGPESTKLKMQLSDIQVIFDISFSSRCVI